MLGRVRTLEGQRCENLEESVHVEDSIDQCTRLRSRHAAPTDPRQPLGSRTSGPQP